MQRIRLLFQALFAFQRSPLHNKVQRCLHVSSLDKVFRGFLIIGLVMLGGRIVTAICREYDIAFTTFFTDYHIVSLLILAIGILGTEMKNYQKKKGRR